MQARCNWCKYTWRLRVLQTSCRRCPNCRSYDIDYLEWGAPSLPKKHIPHETGDAFVHKRIDPILDKWQKALDSRDFAHLTSFPGNLPLLLEQAKRRNADPLTLELACTRYRGLLKASDMAERIRLVELERALRSLDR